MQPDVTPFFTIATTSSGSPNTAIRFWKARCGSGYERLSGRSARNWESRSSPAFCPKSTSTCSSRYHRISRSATSFAVSKGARRIAFRWSSQNFANVTGAAISGRGATSARPAETSQTRRYFSISSIMNLPASAGSYSVDLAGAMHEKLPQATIPRLRIRAFSRRRPLLVDALCRFRAHAFPPSGDGWRIAGLRGVAIAVLVARCRDGCVDFDAGLFQSLYVVEFGVASIGQMLARPFAIICRQGFVHRRHLAHV